MGVKPYEMNAEERFLQAMLQFTWAGLKLAEVWNDDDERFYADEVFPLPEAIRPPMSLDEWMMELRAHYMGSGRVVKDER